MDVLMHDDPHFRRFLREFQRLLPDYAASAAYLDVVGVGVKRIGKAPVLIVPCGKLGRRSSWLEYSDIY